MPNTRQEPHHDDIRLRAWRAIMEAQSTLLPIFDREFQEQLLLDVQVYDVLLHTYEAGTPGIRMSDLASKVLLTKSGLTARIDRLEQRDMVRRVPDPEDRRATRVVLTDHGAAVFREAAAFHMTSVERHFSTAISDDEARTIVTAIERVLDGIG